MKLLTPEMVVAIHNEGEARYCGVVTGKYDLDKLVSVLSKAPLVDVEQSSMYYPFCVAARYCAEILIQRPFPKGNGGTAIASAAAFLALNDQNFELWEPEIPRLLEGHVDEEMFADWFIDCMVPITQPLPLSRSSPIPPRNHHKAHGPSHRSRSNTATAKLQ